MSTGRIELRNTTVLALVIALLASLIATSLPARADNGCVDVRLIWARGSGLGVDSAVDFDPFDTELASRIDTDLGVTYGNY
jgi:hypothetical protein